MVENMDLFHNCETDPQTPISISYKIFVKNTNISDGFTLKIVNEL